jgi:hypothetical protein
LRRPTDLLSDERIASPVVSRSPCSRPALDGAPQSHMLWLDRQTGQMLDILENIMPACSSPAEPIRASRRRRPGLDRGAVCHGERRMPA